MSDWREPLLKPFVTGIARKTVVADPDELFRDDRVFRGITDRGFTLIYFEDSISFRYTYESELGKRGTEVKVAKWLLSLEPDTREFDKLPADLLEGARRLAFYLKDVFSVSLLQRCLETRPVLFRYSLQRAEPIRKTESRRGADQGIHPQACF